MRLYVTWVVCVLAGVVGSVQGQSLTGLGDVSDTYEGRPLTWRVARYTGASAAGTGSASIQFGLAAPLAYTPDGDLRYPLVLYLHGAGARGSNISSVLQRQTARFFAGQAQSSLRYGAFVVAPQVPSGQRWVDVDWADGPYDQTEATYTDSMALTNALIDFLIDGANDAHLREVLGIDANDVDVRRIYLVGDSMGAYGTWDAIGRHPQRYAAAIAASGSGPRNKLDEILRTPFWVIHGQSDSTVPNTLPSVTDPDGAGSLGMLALIDPSFTNTATTDLVKKDTHSTAADDPNLADTLIYTEVPGLAHATVAMEWTTRVSGVLDWLFAHNAPVVTDADINGDREVNWLDAKLLTARWLDIACAAEGCCDGADLDGSGKVDARDLAVLGQSWHRDHSLLPVAWWTLDHESGPLAYDTMGPHHGVLVNMTDEAWIAGPLGQALHFDGVNDRVTVPPVVREDVSIAFWLRTGVASKPTGRSVQWSLGVGLVDADVAGAADDFGTSLYRANVAFGVGQAGGKDVTLLSASEVTDEQWHHVVGTRDATTGRMQLYIDGVLEGETTGPTGAKAAAPTLCIGCIQSSPARCFEGDLDDIRIYDRVLSRDEIGEMVAGE